MPRFKIGDPVIIIAPGSGFHGVHGTIHELHWPDRWVDSQEEPKYDILVPGRNIYGPFNSTEIIPVEQ